MKNPNLKNLARPVKKPRDGYEVRKCPCGIEMRQKRFYFSKCPSCLKTIEDDAITWQAKLKK